MLRGQIVLIFLSSIFASNAELPIYITKCKRSDPNLNLCLKEQANIAFSNLLKGDETTNTPSLFPIVYPRIYLKPMNLDFALEIKKSKVYGLDTLLIEDISIDFKKQTIFMKYFLPTGKWEGIYKASGHINNSTYDHAGKLNIDFAKNTAIFSAEYELVNYEGHFYMQLKNGVFSFNSDKITYGLATRESRYLREANDLMNKLNVEYPDLNKELLPTVKILTAGVLTTIINSVLRTETMCNLFEN